MKELKDLTSKPHPSPVEISRKRKDLSLLLEDAIVENFDFAKDHEFEQFLWRNVFYKPIEEHRTNIKALAKTGDKAKLKSAKLLMREHLNTTNGFYHSLIDKIRSKYDLELEHPIRPADPKYKYYECCARCYVFIGDIARYQREVVDSGVEAQIKIARANYKKAAQLIPGFGNPHNQLAVLCTYKEDDLGALYHYYRAIAAAVPWTTATDNLNVLLNKAQQRYDDFEKDKGGKSQKLGPAARSLVALSLRFILLHKSLFNRSFETFHAEAISNDLHVHLTTQDVAPSAYKLLTRLVICTIFAVQRVFAPHSISGDGMAKAIYTDGAQRSVLLRQYLLHAFDIFRVIAIVYQKMALGANDAAVARAKLLTPLAIFCSWLRYNPSLFDDVQRQGDLLRWRSIKSAMTNLFTTLIAENRQFTLKDIAGRPPLAEDRELFGFTPIQELYANIDFTKQALDETSQEAHERRCERVLAFAVSVAPTVSLSSGEKLVYVFGNKFSLEPFPVTPSTESGGSYVPAMSTGSVFNSAHIQSAQSLLGSSVFAQPASLPQSQHSPNTARVAHGQGSSLGQPGGPSLGPIVSSSVPTFVPSASTSASNIGSPSLMTILQQDPNGHSGALNASLQGKPMHSHGLPAGVGASPSRGNKMDEVEFDESDEKIVWAADLGPAPAPVRSSAPIGSERARTPGVLNSSSNSVPAGISSPHVRRPQQLFEEEDEDEQGALEALRNDTMKRLLPQGLFTTDVLQLSSGAPTGGSHMGFAPLTTPPEFGFPFARKDAEQQQPPPHFGGNFSWGPLPWADSAGHPLPAMPPPQPLPPNNANPYWVPPMPFAGMPGAAPPGGGLIPPGFALPHTFGPPQAIGLQQLQQMQQQQHPQQHVQTQTPNPKGGLFV